MNRREVLQSMGMISAHALFPSILSGFVASCTSPEKQAATFSPLFFTQQELDEIAQVIDVIIPATKTKSASEVNTHLFLDEVFAKCLTADQQKVMREGVSNLLPAFEKAEDKLSLLTEIDKKAYDNDESTAYFRTLKQYTLVGFFTSQEGETKASNYVKFPGDYDGDVKVDENTLNNGDTSMRYYL
ncbi:gluconate 2-dehydrogenase subunit 3 family protein [Flammeovirgaceae bacterium SG7u.111]|nr:gluconate 2-dehydrogenase subunit 3 family protein [Flammeovirgaceae bacterium SG7u.132]WPO36606.1 gluconate 2-dehydrogenase subunit 3 family protein [Flammeovirgaceae bacterium SG7u.111]